MTKKSIIAIEKAWQEVVGQAFELVKIKGRQESEGLSFDPDRYGHGSQLNEAIAAYARLLHPEEWGFVDAQTRALDKFAARTVLKIQNALDLADDRLEIATERIIEPIRSALSMASAAAEAIPAEWYMADSKLRERKPRKKRKAK